MVPELQREAAAVRVLVVSRNLTTIELLCQHMQETGMHVEISCDTESATRKLCHAKFEGVVVDFELPDGALLLKKVRELTSHQHAISLAIANRESEIPSALRSHTNFVLNHPLSNSSVSLVLRASYPMMFRERQRYYRYPIEVRTLIKTGSGAEFSSRSINISESGIAVHLSAILKVGAALSLSLELPGLGGRLNFSGEVQWTDGNGRTGIRFLNLPAEMVANLRAWISEQMYRMIPNSPLRAAAGRS